MEEAQWPPVEGPSSASGAQQVPGCCRRHQRPRPAHSIKALQPVVPELEELRACYLGNCALACEGHGGKYCCIPPPQNAKRENVATTPTGHLENSLCIAAVYSQFLLDSQAWMSSSFSLHPHTTPRTIPAFTPRVPIRTSRSAGLHSGFDELPVRQAPMFGARCPSSGFAALRLGRCWSGQTWVAKQTGCCIGHTHTYAYTCIHLCTCVHGCKHVSLHICTTCTYACMLLKSHVDLDKQMDMLVHQACGIPLSVRVYVCGCSYVSLYVYIYIQSCPCSMYVCRP